MVEITNLTADINAKFWTGVLCITTPADKTIERADILDAFHRHEIGNWGELCGEDREANERALELGERLFSAYHDRDGVEFWIITEADRSATTVLLPDDY